MFSQTAEYALRAAVAMAQSGGQPLTTALLAERTRVPAPYLSKVLQLLGRAGVITAIRGLHGGYQLAQPAGRTMILAVVNAVDPLQRITTCPLGIKEHGTHLCPLHRQLDDVIAQVEKVFGSTSIADLLQQPSSSVPLCAGPGVAAGDAVARLKTQPAPCCRSQV
jgi:Rrf2 family protein